MTESNTLPATAPAHDASPGEPPGTGGPAARASRRRGLLEHLEAYALLGLLLLVGLFFSVLPATSDTFLTSANIQVLIAGQAVVAIVALALLIPLCANEWDLSVGATAALAAVFAATVMSDTGLVAGLLVGLGVGAAVGLANAIIVTRFKVNAVIATLGMATIIAGVINLETAGLSVVSDIPQALTDLGSGTWLGIPRIGFVVLLVALATHYVLGYTPYGRYLYALGANPTAARLVGLRSGLILATSFVIAGVLAGAGGLLAVARAGGADPQLGDQLLLPAFAAAFLSAASIKPGRYNVGGLLVAVYFLAVLNNGLSLAGAKPYINLFVNGAALIVGVGIASYLGRKRRGEKA